MNQNTMLRPALIGGVLLGILSAIPPLSFLNCACCAWVIGGGVLAAHLYVKASPHVVTLGTGVALGLLTGAIGGIVNTIFSIPVQMLMNSVFADYAAQARRMISELPNMPPVWRDIILSSGSAGFSFLAVAVAGFVTVTVYALFAMLGGVLGVALFEKRTMQSTGEVPPPPVHIPPPPPPDYPEQ